MEQHRITIAAVQPPYPPGNTPELHAGTRERGLDLLLEAIERKCDLICLPEYFNCVGLTPELALSAAQRTEELRSEISELAREHSTHILLPLVEQRHGCVFNTCHLFGPDGLLLFSYDKVHVTKGERDDLGLTPGDAADVFPSQFGNLAVATCYDIYFPELFRDYMLQDARFVLFPSLQRSDSPEAVLNMVATRAMDCCAFFIRASYGTPEGQAWKPGMSYGASCILHPDGTILANAGHYEGIALATVNSNTVWRRQRCHGYAAESVRAFLIEDRRPELFGGNKDADT